MQGPMGLSQALVVAHGLQGSLEEHRDLEWVAEKIGKSAKVLYKSPHCPVLGMARTPLRLLQTPLHKIGRVRKSG